jgi:transposase
MWVLLRPPQFGGVKHANDHDHRSRHCKSVFQVHSVDAEDRVIIRGQLKRRYVLAFFAKLQPCLVGMEACASSHYWSRELKALGHTVRLMPPAYVKPYVKHEFKSRRPDQFSPSAVTHCVNFSPHRPRRERRSRRRRRRACCRQYGAPI